MIFKTGESLTVYGKVRSYSEEFGIERDGVSGSNRLLLVLDTPLSNSSLSKEVIENLITTGSPITIKFEGR